MQIALSFLLIGTCLLNGFYAFQSDNYLWMAADFCWLLAQFQILIKEIVD